MADITNRTCRACGDAFPATTEFFVTLRKRMRNGTLWSGLAAECRPCRNKRFHPYYKKNRKKLIAYATARTQAFRITPEGAEKSRIWARNRARIRFANPKARKKATKRNREWRKKNPNRVKLFKHNQLHIRAERTMRRYAARDRATPAWADLKAIRSIYEKAARLTRETGIPHHVDHIYPIAGKTCCGLHIEANLQIIQGSTNQRKGNKIEPRFDTWLQWELRIAAGRIERWRRLPDNLRIDASIILQPELS
jgi:hypothetical protein